MMKDTVRLDPSDNVVTATRALEAGISVNGAETTGLIPSGHKIATATIRQGEAVRKYAQVIGYAAADIAPGDHVHVHNLEFRPTDGRLRVLYRPAPGRRPRPATPSWAIGARTAASARATTSPS